MMIKEFKHLIQHKTTTYPSGTSIFKGYENEMINVCSVKEALGKKSDESEGELYKRCTIFLNHLKRKCTMEMEKKCKITTKKL